MTGFQVRNTLRKFLKEYIETYYICAIYPYFAGPSLPHTIHHTAMATSPNGRGVILFGGFTGMTDVAEDTIRELHYYSTDWTILPQKLKHPREDLTVIPFP